LKSFLHIFLHIFIHNFLYKFLYNIKVFLKIIFGQDKLLKKAISCFYKVIHFKNITTLKNVYFKNIK